VVVLTGHFHQGAWVQDSPDPFHPFLRIEVYAGVQEGRQVIALQGQIRDLGPHGKPGTAIHRYTQRSIAAIQAEANRQPAAETKALEGEIAAMLKELG
jgi:hypothetical protein